MERQDWGDVRQYRQIGTKSHLETRSWTSVLVSKRFPVHHLPTALWLGLISSLLIAAMSFRYVEQPLQRRFRRRLERVQLVPAAADLTSQPDAEPTPAAATDPDRVIDLTALERHAPSRPPRGGDGS